MWCISLNKPALSYASAKAQNYRCDGAIQKYTSAQTTARHTRAYHKERRNGQRQSYSVYLTLLGLAVFVDLLREIIVIFLCIIVSLPV